MMHTLESIFKRIRSITSSVDVNFLHLVEEVGEISTELIIEKGGSYKTQSEGVFGETCDALICILAILANKTNSLEEMLDIVDTKLTKWENNYLTRNKFTKLPTKPNEFAVKD